MTAEIEPNPTAISRWETVLWPRWLPVRMRLPLIAQVTGGVALTALIIGPWWASIPNATPPVASTAFAASAVAPVRTAVTPETPPQRPAHLNLDVRHTFGSIDLSVTVDGKSALQTKVSGSGKRFKVFGKRAESSLTRTIDLPPGVRVVRVRVQSAADKFDQTKVERFDLESSDVAGLQISADKSGLSLVSERTTAPAPKRAATPPPAATPEAPAPKPEAPAAPVQASALPVSTPVRQDAGATSELLQSLRSMLIGIAGFVASTATAFLIQEFLRSRKALLFADEEQPFRRRRRARREPTM